MSKEIIGRINHELWKPLTKAFDTVPDKQRGELFDWLQARDFFRPGTPPSETHRGVFRELHNREQYYAVRDEEFNVWQKMMELIVGAVAEEHFLKQGIITLGYLLLCYCQFRKSKIPLDSWQAIPLMALSKAKPKGIQLDTLAEQANMEPEAVREALEALRDIRRPNGERKDLVEEYNGYWYALDV